MINVILIVSGINIFILSLCGIIVLCESFLKQSGTANITIGNDLKAASVGQTLLSACMENGICLPAACGGKGTCGKCRIKVISGGGSITPFEKIRLSAQDLKNGARLACQLKIRENIELDSSEAMKGASSFKARLVNLEKVSDRIKIFYFEYVSGCIKSFKAGQYAQVCYKLPWETVTRAYSISSANDKGFSLDIQAVDGGLVSNYMHNLPIGAELEFNGSFGDMVLPDKLPEKCIVLIAGGVGLAPMRAMIDELIAIRYSGKIMLFQGARDRQALYLEKYYRKLAEQHDNFIYFPALSEPKLQDGWNGFVGMVHELLDSELKEVSEIECFICGPKPMMAATEKNLCKKGVESDRIHSDPFDF